MKNLKIKLLTLGVLAAVTMSSMPVSAATNTKTTNAVTSTSKTPTIPSTIKLADADYEHFAVGFYALVHTQDPTSAVNVRIGPGTSYDVRTSLENGTRVFVDGRSGNWYHIGYPTMGFVRQDFLKQQ